MMFFKLSFWTYFLIFFFNDTATTEIYTLSLHDALPIFRGLAVEMARYGITANSIIPGWVETAMTSARVGDDKFEDRVMKRVPVRRWGQPED